ncbi:SMI1/KNR4 family protein [Sphingomonas sp. HITSZ_GF]|uniref:SMI1/KNR4 family protein n=1 Tax=Sphingomonas sp. HITSZ_GF TaxID=3037247 RepID=UPI00240D6C9E|nr:SMI1/KNR4 family protein [Sphingomonas sp. HITSZ_GF]MDG2534321.1 SMI1/KNR4 family protein [Sphingomonas sp. HITSZ_GF]
MGWFAGWLSRRAANRRRQSEFLGAHISPETRAAVEAAQARRARAFADPTLSPLAALLTWWGQPPVASPPEPEIRALEVRYALRLPDDFRAYLMATMPQGNEWDDEGTRWFPLADIKSLGDETTSWETKSTLDNDKLLVFADFLMWCYAWAVDCSDTENRGKVALIAGSDRHPDHYVADSFDDFLARYLRDDHSLHQ